MRFTSCLSDICQKWIQTAFYHYGVSVANHPFLYLICGILMTGISILGFGNFSYENRTVYLYIPQDSDSFKNFETSIEYFGEFDTEAILIVENTNGDNLLTPENMDLMFDIFHIVTNITVDYLNKKWTFDDICERPYDGFPYCTSEISGFFGMFGFDSTTWMNQSDILQVIDDYSSVIGLFVGNKIKEDNVTIGGSFVRLTFEIGGTSNDTITEIGSEFQYAFEEYWELHSQDYLDSDNIIIRYITDKSFGSELDRTVSADTPVLGAAFVVMLIFLSLTLGRKLTCVEARPIIAFTTLGTVVAALIMGFGIGSALGYSMNAIVLLIPFILLGVGVDDDIIIIETIDRTDLPDNDPNKEDIKLGHAMQHAGLSITLTSLSSVVAFGIGSIIDMPGINAFCIFAAFSFFTNFFCQFVIFVPILTFDEKRIAANRNFCLCCIKHKRDPNAVTQSTAQDLMRHAARVKSATHTAQNSARQLPMQHSTGGYSTGNESVPDSENENETESARATNNESEDSANDTDGTAGTTDANQNENTANEIEMPATTTTTTATTNAGAPTQTGIQSQNSVTAQLAAWGDPEMTFNSGGNVKSVSSVGSAGIAPDPSPDPPQMSPERSSTNSQTNPSGQSNASGGGNGNSNSSGVNEGGEEFRQFDKWYSKISLEYILVHTLVPFLSNRLARIIIILTFCGLLGLSMYAFQFIDTETDTTKLVPDDSFIIDFLEALEAGYGKITFGTVDIIVENRDFSDETLRNQVLDMIDYFDNEFDSDYGTFIGDVNQWMYDYHDWLISDQNVTVDDLSQTEYYIYLQEFTNNADYKEWESVIVYDDSENPTKIVATKFSVSTEYTLSLKQRWNWVVQATDAFNENMGGGTDNGYLYAPAFVFAYLAFVIVDLTINNLVFAAIGLFCVLILLMDVRMSFFMIIIIAMIDVDLIGWMILNDIALDTLSYTELVMAVGLTVDYVIHISHAIVHATPIGESNWQARLEVAMRDMGIGVFTGAFTTFIGIMTLIFSQSEAFRVFFLMFVGIILLALLHGFLFVPAIMAECPFIWSEGDGAHGHSDAHKHEHGHGKDSDDDDKKQAMIVDHVEEQLCQRVWQNYASQENNTQEPNKRNGK